MKKIISLLCILILCITGIEALARIEITTLPERTISTQRTYRVSINFPTNNNVTIRHEHDGMSIQLDGYSYHIDPGKPMLPSKTYVIALPPGAKVESINVKGIHEKQLPGKYTITPAPMTISREYPVGVTGSTSLVVADTISVSHWLIQVTHSSDLFESPTVSNSVFALSK